jgi:hypothetical protein
MTEVTDPALIAQLEQPQTQINQMPSEVDIPGDPKLAGDEYLASLNPAMASQVKMLADGRLNIPTGMALAKPYWQSLLQATAQYDPSFDAANAATRRKTRLEFTSGQAARNITSFNTALGHLDTLSHAAAALDNGSWQKINSLRNWWREETGDPRINAFNTAKTAVVNEIDRAFKGSAPTVSGITEWESAINASQSPEQLKAAIKQMADLLGSRVKALGEQYDAGMGRSSDPINLLDPHAQDVMRRYNWSATATPGAPLDPTGEGDIGFNNRREVLGLPKGAEGFPRELETAMQAGTAVTPADIIRFGKERGFVIDPGQARAAAAALAKGVMPDVRTPQFAKVDIGDARGKGGVPESLDANIRGVADTMTMGLASEGAAGLESVFGSNSKRYNMAKENAIDDYDEQHHAVARFLGQLEGGLALPSGITGAARTAGITAFRAALRSGVPREAAAALARQAARQAGAVRAGREGAAYGAAYGAGSGEGNILDRADDAIGGALTGFATGRGAPAVANAFGAATGRARNAFGDIAARLNIDPTPATVGGRAASALQTVLLNAPGSSIPVQGAVEREASQLGDAARATAAQMGPVVSREEAGNAVTRGARAYGRLGSTQGRRLYAERDRLMGGPDVPVTMASTHTAFRDFAQQYPTSPMLEALRIHPAIRRLEEATSGSPTLTLAEAGDALSFARTQLRNLRSRQKISRQEEAQAGQLEQAIEDDVMRAAQNADLAAGRTSGSGSAQGAQQAADAHWANLRRTTDGAMKVATRASRDDLAVSGSQVYNDLFGTITEGRSNLRRFDQMWGNLPRAARRTFSATAFHDLGRATPGQQNAEGTAWSFNTFLTNWDKVDDSVKRRVFGEADYQRVRDIVSYSDRLKSLGRGRNTSNTARHSLAGAWGATVMSSLLMGNETAAATAAAGFPAMAFVGETFMRSPQGRRWLATALRTAASGSPGRPQLRALTNRLKSLAATDPAIEEDVLGLRKKLMDTLGTNDTND